ncbi:phage tail assembly protein [Neobacillus mesonae]|uniref:phage tail assembly protein n=1 Tax=Neobacillus mesonae TaxID=1193713 RepID=UPI00203ACD0A|nr:phage tail assembly protein [Neobacillus mesonae]MCM3567849.1 phage tail assembly protein [Neobacillus mesonae]
MSEVTIEKVEKENVVVFNKPVQFEGKEYKEVDLSGLDSLTAADLIEADKVFGTSGQFAVVNEMTLGYTLIVASRASNLPIEFFNQLPAREGLKVKNKVMAFLNN